MNEIVPAGVYLPAMTEDQVGSVARLEDEVLKLPQVDFRTRHMFHAGTYVRSIIVPKHCLMTGALIKIPTVLIVSGDITVYTGVDSFRLTGYHVLQGSAGRKQAFYAHEETDMSMFFASKAKTVDEAEREFTDEYERLASRRQS